MIQAEHKFEVAAAHERVWGYVVQIRNWAELMPGLQDCDIIDDNDSRWTLKVGVGGMVRTVKVAVHVDEWDGPERATFSYKLQGDPVEGGGSYTARPIAPDRTEIVLAVRVAGSGPMAPMWEALGRPVLPTFVKAFAGQLKEKIEAETGAPASAAPQPDGAPGSLLGRIAAWFKRLWRSLRGAPVQPG